MISINKPFGINKNQSEVKVEFSGKNLTAYGGLGLFSRFSHKLGIEKVMDKIKERGLRMWGINPTLDTKGDNIPLWNPS